MRFLQWRQAREATESLLRTRATTLERYKYYLRLLGQTLDSSAVPDTFSPDRRKLTEENFDDAYSALVSEYDKTMSLQAYPSSQTRRRRFTQQSRPGPPEVVSCF